MNRLHRLIITALAGGPSDTTAPTVTITSSESSPSFANPIPLTFTLSEVSTNFVVGDITVGAGGTIGNFAGSGASYTADLTVTTAGATVTVDVAGGSFTDAAGNGNTAATQFSITSGLLLKDEFTTADATPLTTPRTCEPGPGVLVVIDTENKLSIAGAALVAAGGKASPAYGDPGIFSQATHTRAAGLAHVVRVSISVASNSYLGFSTVNSGQLNQHGFRTSAGTVFTYLNGTASGADVGATDAYSLSTNYKLYTVLRSTGAFYVVDNKLMWVAVLGNTAALYSAITSRELQATIDYNRVGNLAAPWTTDNGIATNVVASPAVGEITTQEANAIVEMSWTAVTGQTWNLMVRRTDDDNAWYVRGDQAGSTIKLIEKNATVETERATAAQTWTNGNTYRVIVIMDGNVIRVLSSTGSTAAALKNTYSSASFNNTATGVKTDRAGTNLIAWPRTLSGSALTALNQLTP